MKSLFHNHPIIYLAVNGNKIIEKAQGNLLAALGLSNEKLIGCPISVFFDLIKIKNADAVFAKGEAHTQFFVHNNNTYLLSVDLNNGVQILVTSDTEIDIKILLDSKHANLLLDCDVQKIVYINELAEKTFANCLDINTLQNYFLFPQEWDTIVDKIKIHQHFIGLVHLRTPSSNFSRAICTAKLIKRADKYLTQLLWYFESNIGAEKQTWEDKLLLVSDIFVSTDENLKIIFANQGLNNFEREDLMGANLVNVLDEETFLLVKEKIDECRTNYQAVTFEGNIKLDSNRRYSYRCLLSQKSNGLGYDFVVNQIIPDAVKDEFFNHSNKNIHYLMESFPDNLFILDKNLQIKAYHLAANNNFANDDLLDMSIENVFGEVLIDKINEIILTYDFKFKRQAFSFDFEMSKNEKLIYWEGRISRVNKERYILIIRNVTSERKALLAVKKQKKEYYDLLSNIDEFIYSYSVKKIPFISSRVKVVLGYQEDDFNSNIGYWLRIVHKEDREKVLNALKEIVKNKSTVTISYRIKEKKADFYHWIVDKITARFDENNNFAGIIGIAKDVSLEKKLINQNQLFSSLIESSHELIALTSLSGEISFINKRGISIMQAKHRDEVVDKINLLDYLTIENKNKFFADLGEKLLNGKAFNFECLLYSIDKSSYIHTEVTVFLIEINHFSEVKDSLAFIIRDTSERIESKKALKQSELKYRRLVEGMNEGIFVVDTGGAIQFANRRLCEILKYKESDLIGKIIYDELNIPRSATNEELPSDWKNINEEPTEVFIANENDGGTWMLLSYLEIDSENDGIDGYMGILTDVTQIKNTEKNLKEVNRELELLLYRASHDLKSPITSTLGLIDVMRMEANDPHVTHYANMMTDSVQKLESLVLDLIKVSSVKQGEIENRIVNLKAIIDEIIETYTFHPNFERVSLQVQNHSLRPFYSDMTLLRNIFQNLIENAFKYMKPIGFDAFINIDIKDSPKGIVFKIEDNGIGIPKIFQQRIFDMFFRATPNGKGSGMGLFLVKSAVIKLNGQILIESEENIGTTFWVKIPSALP